MIVVYVMVETQIKIVLVYEMDQQRQMNVEHVMLMLQMTVFRIVQVHGVEAKKKIYAVYAMD